MQRNKNHLQRINEILAYKIDSYKENCRLLCADMRKLLRQTSDPSVHLRFPITSANLLPRGQAGLGQVLSADQGPYRTYPILDASMAHGPSSTRGHRCCFLYAYTIHGYNTTCAENTVRQAGFFAMTPAPPGWSQGDAWQKAIVQDAA